jgi:ankyrin repeat protein
LTALHYASKNNNIEIADLLIKYGADTNALDQEKKQPLYYAVVDANSPEIVELLLKNGSRYDIKTSVGITPLKIASNNNLLKEVYNVFLKYIN